MKINFFYLLLLASLCISSMVGCNRSNESYAAKTENLLSLPYIELTEEKNSQRANGTVIYIKNQTYGGYTFIGDRLINMDGKEILRIPEKDGANAYLSEFSPYENNIYTMYELDDGTGAILVKFNESLEVVWEKRFGFHHEIEFSSDKTLWTIAGEPHIYQARNVVFDNLVHLDEKGEIISEWSSFDHIKEIQELHKKVGLDVNPFVLNDNFLEKRLAGPGTSYDYYHLNSIQLLPKNELGKNDARFQEGNLLISLNKADLILILDKDSMGIEWSWGPGDLIRQHSPRMLDSGTILVFDNGDDGRNYTRVIEVDPLTGNITWSYSADPKETFYSFQQGFSQRLPNGNTLITDSIRGRVFEVLKDGNIVWDWFNDKVGDEGYRKSVYRAKRYSKEEIERFIGSADY